MNTWVSNGQGLLAQWWSARLPRERRLLTAGGVVLAAGLLLGLGILPAWRTLRTAPQAQARLDQQWQDMQALQAQSTALRRQGRRDFSETALRESLAPLGEAAELRLGPQAAELTLRNAPADALAQWLLRSREQAGAVVREAQLQRAQREGQAVWNGRIVLAPPVPAGAR